MSEIETPSARGWEPLPAAGHRLSATAIVAMLILLAIFAAGAAAGVALDRYYLLHRDGIITVGQYEVKVPENGSVSPGDRRAAERGIPFHIERLGLTPQQEDALTSIARRRRPQADSIMRALRPLTAAIETEMMQEMLCALTPAQQTHWRAYMDTLKFDPAIVSERYRPIATHTCGTKTP